MIHALSKAKHKMVKCKKNGQIMLHEIMQKSSSIIIHETKQKITYKDKKK